MLNSGAYLLLASCVVCHLLRGKPLIHFVDESAEYILITHARRPASASSVWIGELQHRLDRTEFDFKPLGRIRSLGV